MSGKSGSRKRYRTSGDKSLIEVRVKNAQQLFDVRDPAPFRERDLDDDFVEYISTSVEEIGYNSNLKIVINIGEKEAESIDKLIIKEAIHAYLDYQIELKRLHLSKLFRTVRLFLFFGLASLFTCLFVARTIEKRFDPDSFFYVTREGFVILGWVAIWKPFELVLFDWYPVFDKIKLLRKLRDCEIDIVYVSV